MSSDTFSCINSIANQHRVEMEDYYVYFYLRPDRYSPYYVGKGMGKRAYQKHINVDLPPIERIEIIKDNLTEQEALDLEKTLIKFYGVKRLGGLLENVRRTGQSQVHTEEHKRNISKSMKGKTPWNKGVKITDKKVLDNYKRGNIGKGKKSKPFILEGITYSSQKECAKVYGVSDRAIRLWLKENKVPKHRRMYS